MLLMNMIRQ